MIEMKPNGETQVTRPSSDATVVRPAVETQASPAVEPD